MNPLRTLLVLAMLGVIGLPYTAPALCGLTQSSMVMSEHGAGRDHDRMTSPDSDHRGACDFSECATGPVAVAPAFVVLPVDSVVDDLAGPELGQLMGLEALPPLTPPPAV